MSLPESPSLELFRRFPGLAGRLAHVPLTSPPTGVARLERLSASSGRDIWIKRDDQSSAIYGGNKPRKLEFLLGDALARGRKSVLTTGGIGTHHGLATALCARSVGLETILVLLEQPVTEHVRRCLLLDYAAGAELHWGGSIVEVAARGVGALARHSLRGDVPYIIMTGGTSTLGTIGYVNAAFELAAQIAAGQMPEASHVYVPMGSGGTVAGLVLGLRLAGLRTRVVSVVVTDILPPSRRKIRRLAGRTLAYLRRIDSTIPRIRLGLDDFDVVSRYVGPGYGYPTRQGRHARDVLMELEGIGLDTTYTAKCLAALLDRSSETDRADTPVLFWNTYSSVDPALRLEKLPDYHSLPSAFHRFFEGPVIPA